jgi:hypothetical protein
MGEQMKALRVAFVGFLIAGIVGCGAVRAGTGLEEYADADGVVRVRVKSPSPVDTATGLLTVLGPWGIAASSALLLGQKIIRHREVLAHGQKDDDFDGIPDDQQKPPVNPT